MIDCQLQRVTPATIWYWQVNWGITSFLSMHRNLDNPDKNQILYNVMRIVTPPITITSYKLRIACTHPCNMRSALKIGEDIKQTEACFPARICTSDRPVICAPCQRHAASDPHRCYMCALTWGLHIWLEMPGWSHTLRSRLPEAKASRLKTTRQRYTLVKQPVTEWAFPSLHLGSSRHRNHSLYSPT